MSCLDNDPIIIIVQTPEKAGTDLVGIAAILRSLAGLITALTGLYKLIRGKPAAKAKGA